MLAIIEKNYKSFIFGKCKIYLKFIFNKHILMISKYKKKYRSYCFCEITTVFNLYTVMI